LTDGEVIDVDGRCMTADRGLRDWDVSVYGSRPDAIEEAATVAWLACDREKKDWKPHQILRVIDLLKQRCDARSEPGRRTRGFQVLVVV
jgi:hypothetical protein